MHAAFFVLWLVVVFGVCFFICLFYPLLPAASFRVRDDNHIRKTLLHVGTFKKKKLLVCFLADFLSNLPPELLIAKLLLH